METLIKVLDVICATLIILSLWLTSKSYKAWLLYMVSCMLGIIVYVYKGLPGLGMMCVILIIVSLKNYFIGRKNEEEKKN